MTTFSPDQVGTLALWLDASDTATIVDSDNDGSIEQWIDKSGNDRHGTQTNTTFQPTYDSTAFGSLGGVSFDHVDDFMQLATTSFSGSTIFIVMKTTEDDDQSSYSGSPGMTILGDTSGSVRQGMGLNGDSVDYRHYSGGWNSVSGGTDLNDGSAHLIASSHDTATNTATVYADTIAVSTETDSVSSTSIRTLGRGYGSGSFFGGEIAEILVYDGALSDAERQDVEAYLGQKWSLSYSSGPPNAADDLVTTDSGAALTILPAAILSNDSDPDSDPIDIVSVSNAQNGSAVLNGDGTITFTPASGFVGYASFDYTIDDNVHGTDTATVTVQVGTTPDMVSGLKLWLDASDASTIVDADSDGKIEEWSDKSGADFDATQATQSERPTYDASGFNGRGGVSFDHVDDHLDLTRTSFSGGSTFFAVFQTTVFDDVSSHGASPGMALVGDTSGGTYQNFGLEGNDIDFRHYSGGWKSVSGGDPDLTDGSTHVLSATHDGATGAVTLYLDGQLVGSGNIPFSGSAALNVIGRSYGGGTFLGADIGELIVYDGAVSAIDRQAIEGYLTQKWVSPGTAPEAYPDYFLGDQDTALTLTSTQLIQNDIDAEQDPLHVSAVGNAQNGAVVLNQDGSVTFTPDAGFSGITSYDYTVSDGNGGTDTGTVTLEIARTGNLDPDARADRFEVLADGTLEFTLDELVANDLDGDGDTISVIAVDNPMNGTLQDLGSGNFLFTPSTGFSGAASFNYTVTDSHGGRATVAAHVNVIDPAGQAPGAAGTSFTVNTSLAGTERDASVSRLSGGGYVITWKDDDGGVYARVFDASDTAVTGEIVISATAAADQALPVVTGLKAGGFVASWVDLSGVDGDVDGIMMRRYDSAGQALSTEELVNTHNPSVQTQPEIAALEDGGYFIAWRTYLIPSANHSVAGQRYDANGQPVDGEFEINSYHPVVQQNPAVAGLQGGGYVVLWESEGQDGSDFGVFGQRFGADGLKVGGEFQVNQQTYDDQHEIQTVGLANGGFVVVWRSQGHAVVAGSESFGRLYGEDGAPIGDQFLLHDDTEWAQVSPDVAALPDGGFVAVWSRADAGVLMRRFTARGTPLGGDITMDVNGQTDGAPSITTLDDGDVIVSWVGLYDVFAQRFSIPGPTQGGAGAQTLTGSAGDDALSGAAGDDTINGQDGADDLYGGDGADTLNGGDGIDRLTGGAGADTLDGGVGDDLLRGDGGDDVIEGGAGSDEAVYLGFYEDFAIDVSGGTVTVADRYGDEGTDTLTGVEYLRFHDRVIDLSQPLPDPGVGRKAPAPATPDEQVVHDLLGAGNQFNPAIAALSGGGYVVVWQDDSGIDGDLNGVFARRYDADGAPAGPEFQLNVNTNSEQVNAQVTGLSNDGFAVAWIDRDGQSGSFSRAVYRLYDATGTAVTGELDINSPTIGQHATPRLTALAGGGFMAVWREPDWIKVRRFDAAGSPTGAAFEVNTGASRSVETPSAVLLEDGGYAVTWVDADSSGNGVYARIYDDQDVAVTGPFQINTTFGDDQEKVEVAALKDGGFVAVWQSRDQDGDGEGVYFRVFDSAGQAQTGEIRANDLWLDAQWQPTVATLPDGDFIIGWKHRDHPETGVTGAYMRRFASDGTALSDEVRVENYDGIYDEPAAATLTDGRVIFAYEGRDLEPGRGIVTRIVDVPDRIAGGAGEDVILGREREDILVGGAGCDTLTGAGGDDVLLGGEGADRAVFAGDMADYAITTAANGDVLVTDTVAGDGDEGTDRLVDMERIVFADQTHLLVANIDPAASDDTLAAVEDQSLMLAQTDLAGNDTDADCDPLTVVFVGNASVGTVVLNQDGTVTFTAPAHFSGVATFDYTVEDPFAGQSTATATVTVQGVADPASVSSATASGDEDTAIPLSLSVAPSADTDGSETLSVSLSGLPTGGTLQDANGTIAVVGGVADLTGADLASLTLTPPADLSGTLQLTLAATTTESDGDQTTVSEVFDISIVPVADAPTLSVQAASGDEDTAIALSIDAALTDLDGSEALTVTIANVPVGASLSAGIDKGGGVWLVDGQDLAGLSITPPANADQNFALQLSATATEGANGETATTGPVTLAVTVDAVADAPTASALDVSGDEDTAIALSILIAESADTDGSETLSARLTGVPAGAVLTAVNLATMTRETLAITNGESADLVAYDVSTVEFTPPADANGAIGLALVSRTTEGSNGDLTETTDAFTVTVAGINDAPTISGMVSDAVSEDDAGAAVDLLGQASDIDGDGLDVANAYVTVSDGRVLTFSLDAETGQLSFDPDQFDDLADGESVQITVTYDVTDGALMTAATASIDVSGSNDAPTDIVITALQVAENAAGASIGTLSVTDIDASDTHTLGVDDNRFELTGAGVLKLKSGVSLDYETETSIPLTITATDPQGQQVAKGFTVTVSDVNDDPTATGGKIVLAYGAGTVAGRLVGADAETEAGALTYSLVSGPSNGSVTVQTDGSYSFTPVGSFQGTDSFVFQVDDGNGGAATATQSVAIGDPTTLDYSASAGGDLFVGGSAAETLAGGAGDDVLLGGAGDDTLSGGLGSDLFEVAAGDGADVVASSGFDGTSVDTLRFTGSTGSDDLWFDQQGDDLRVSRLGTTDSVTLGGWFATSVTSDDRMDRFEVSGSAEAMTEGNVQQLVDAMATWSANNSGQDGDDLSSMPTGDTDLDQALAAAWTPIS